MTTNKELLKLAKGYLGNGGAVFRKHCHLGSGDPYCCAYVRYIFDEGGLSKLFYGGKIVTYCPTAYAWCQANLAQIPPIIAQAMDVIFFDWQPNGRPDHIGFVEEHVSPLVIKTLEGNTSAKVNGKTVSGIVAEKDRNTVYVQGIFRPLYDPPKKLEKAELKEDGNFSWKSVYMLQIALGISKPTGILTKDTVKALQKKVGTAADGSWLKKTCLAVNKWTGHSKTATFDVGSVKALQRKINAVVFKETSTKPPETSTSDDDTSTLPLKCIDVSYWQGKITEDNWKKIKKSCKYAIIRASYTSQKKFTLSKDSTFGTNYVNAKSAGLTVGVYHYSQAITVDEAKAEAEYLCDILKDFTAPTFWVVCDYEFGGRLNSKIGKKASAIANAFCEVVEQHGYKACIYANLTMLNKYLTEPKYPVWIAQYNSTCSYKKEKVMWQYTSSGKVDGISGKVDLSHVYAVPVPVVEKKGYEGTFPTANNNIKIVNGMCYRMCYPYGTPQKKYTYADGKPREAYAKGIDEAFPNHMSWSNKKQRVGACCDMLPGTVLRLIGIPSPKHLKDQVKELPKMTDKLKDNGHYKANEFVLGDFVQRFKSTGHGHTWFVCELINGEKYVANAHYRKLEGAYAVMDAKPSTVDTSKYASYHCFTILGAIRTWYEKGDYGYDVLYIQKFLNWYGIQVTEDGDFGPKLEAAVEKYQKARDLTVDGKVGAKTIEDMKKVLR